MHTKQCIARAFNRAALSYDVHCQLQIATGKKLIALIKPHIKQAKHIFDVGCGTGITTQYVAAEWQPENLRVLDIAESLLARAKTRLADFNTIFHQGDFDALTVQQSAYDIIFSNMALHWSECFQDTLLAMLRSIHANGVVGFTVPLINSLVELRHCLVNTFPSQEMIKAILQASECTVLTESTEKIILNFTSPLAALRSLKHIGANTVCKREQRGLSGKSLLKKHTASTLTYHIGYFVVSKR